MTTFLSKGRYESKRGAKNAPEPEVERPVEVVPPAPAVATEPPAQVRPLHGEWLWRADRGQRYRVGLFQESPPKSRLYLWVTRPDGSEDRWQVRGPDQAQRLVGELDQGGYLGAAAP